MTCLGQLRFALFLRLQGRLIFFNIGWRSLQILHNVCQFLLAFRNLSCKVYPQLSTGNTVIWIL